MTEPRKSLDELAAERGVGPVTDPESLAAPLEHRLTDTEFEAWQAAIHGCRGEIGDRYDAPESSPYARLLAYAEGGDTVPAPSDVRELLAAFNAADAMNRVAKRTADNHRRRMAAIRALADTDDDIDPEALRRALAIGTRDEHAATHPSTAQFRQWIADLQDQLEDARDEIDFLQRRATEH
jgi:hypothetical protein